MGDLALSYVLHCKSVCLGVCDGICVLRVFNSKPSPKLLRIHEKDPLNEKLQPGSEKKTNEQDKIEGKEEEGESDGDS